jgi:predicted RNA binding protein YcfA (HicA-like mRNA interferase family)
VKKGIIVLAGQSDSDIEVGALRSIMNQAELEEER